MTRCSLPALLVVVSVVVGQQLPSCPDKCDLSACGPYNGSECKAGEVKDECGCCPVCAQGEGQLCDYADALDPRGKNGACGDYLECKLRQDIGDVKEGICVCVHDKPVCGTNNITYENLCKLRAAKSVSGEPIKVKTRGRCPQAAKVKYAPHNTHQKVGENLVLSCEASGNPIPHIWWTFTDTAGETVILPGDDDRISLNARGGPGPYSVTAWLQIVNLSNEHEGDYTCFSQNGEGEDQKVARVKVMQKGEGL